MRLQDVMTDKVSTIEAHSEAAAARERMDRLQVHHLVVMDGGDVVGVVSDRDLGGRKGQSVVRGRRVADVMTAQVVSAKPSHTVRQAANLMRGRGVGCLPVVEDGKLKGIVTVTDLLELIGRGLEKPVARTERAILSRRQGKSRKVSMK